MLLQNRFENNDDNNTENANKQQQQQQQQQQRVQQQRVQQPQQQFHFVSLFSYKRYNDWSKTRISVLFRYVSIPYTSDK